MAVPARNPAPEPIKLGPTLLIGILGIFAIAIYSGIYSDKKTAYCSTEHKTSTIPPSHPATASDFFALGDYAYEIGACDKAVASYTRALELDPMYAEAYNNRAYAYMMQGDYAHAVPDLDRAIVLRPDYVKARMNLGDIFNYYYQIDRKKAVDDYDRVIALGPAAMQGTGVCSHRLHALYGGWTLEAFAALMKKGAGAGCQ